MNDGIVSKLSDFDWKIFLYAVTFDKIRITASSRGEYNG